MMQKGNTILMTLLKFMAALSLLLEGRTLITEMEPFLLPSIFVHLWLNVVLWHSRPERFYLIIAFVTYRFLNSLYWFVTSTFMMSAVSYSQEDKLVWGILTLFFAWLLGWTFRARDGLGYRPTTPHTKCIVVVLMILMILMSSGYLSMDTMGLSGHEQIKIPRENIMKGEISPDGNYLVLSLLEGKNFVTKTIVWDIRTRQTVRTLLKILPNRIKISPDGNYVGMVGNFDDASLKVWEIHSGMIKKTVQSNKRKNEHIYCFSFSADSKKFAYGAYDGARIEDLQEKESDSINVTSSDLNTSPNTWPVPFAVGYSPNHDQIVLARYQEVSLWNSKTHERIAVLKSGLSVISHVDFIEFSKDGRYFAMEGILYKPNGGKKC